MTLPLSRDSADPTPLEHHASRVYVAIVVAGILIFVVLVGAMAWRLGPPVGDLGRISGLGSRDFGRQDPATGYAQDHFSQISHGELMAGTAPGDLLVIGDSFSIPHAGGISWLNTLASHSGMHPVSVYGASFPGLMDYLVSDAFTTEPPKAILVQNVERTLVQKVLSIYDPADCPAPPEQMPARLTAVPGPALATIPLPPRPEGFTSLEDLLSWAGLSVRTRIKGSPRIEVRNLNRSDLFSNRASDQVLLYHADFKNHTPAAIAPLTTEEVRSRITCGLGRLVNAAGDVPLWVVVAPDKRSIYEPWIIPTQPAKVIDVFEHLDSVLDQRFIDLRSVLMQAAEDGMRDIYWPDDTHWGALGNVLSGNAVASAILLEP